MPVTAQTCVKLLIFFGPCRIATIALLLRRTLILSFFYAAINPTFFYLLSFFYALFNSTFFYLLSFFYAPFNSAFFYLLSFFYAAINPTLFSWLSAVL